MHTHKALLHFKHGTAHDLRLQIHSASKSNIMHLLHFSSFCRKITELVTLTFPLSEIFKVPLLMLWQLSISNGVLDRFRFLNFVLQKEYGDL